MKMFLIATALLEETFALYSKARQDKRSSTGRGRLALLSRDSRHCAFHPSPCCRSVSPTVHGAACRCAIGLVLPVRPVWLAHVDEGYPDRPRTEYPCWSMSNS
jgi:hypothetical protein